MVVICDNAPYHSRLESIVNATSAILLRLSPYCPMFNPTDTMWSKIKAYAKTALRVSKQRNNYKYVALMF